MILSSPYPLSEPEEPLHATILRRCLEIHAQEPNRKAFVSYCSAAADGFQIQLALCSWFQEQGFKKGEVVLLFMYNSWQFVASCIGAWSAGLIVSPASSSFTEPNAVRQRMPVKDLLLLPYSSGTSGLPKGVMISHRNYAMMLQSYTRSDFKAIGLEGYAPPTYAITVLPFYHVMGLFGMIMHMVNGTTQLLMRKFDLSLWLQHIQDYKITMVSIVPAIALQMAYSPLLDNYDLSSLFMIASGSAPLSQSVVDRLQKRLPNVSFRQGYGMTELSVASHTGSMDTPDGSVGKLLPGTRMKVVDENGRLCGPNEQGEMWISGPQVMVGYWKRPELMKESFDSDGFMRTGDVVYYDSDGFTFVCDRMKELIKVNGKQVSPSEIEALLLSLPGVSDCCVFGVPDERHGEAPVAYVVSKTVNEEQINALVKEYELERILLPSQKFYIKMAFMESMFRGMKSLQCVHSEQY
ncbi:unnamed protein product [Heligmosomoides polygyrus]|uniref:AMP-binding domain-containing protein n=1 Tax=Heligmosomoides polygyrus TaxID=6339 RepID=A0A3P8ADG1_HELPZ|nr:unnamed protein product [Heligmosomoides polygyrus]